MLSCISPQPAGLISGRSTSTKPSLIIRAESGDLAKQAINYRRMSVRMPDYGGGYPFFNIPLHKKQLFCPFVK